MRRHGAVHVCGVWRAKLGCDEDTCDQNVLGLHLNACIGGSCCKRLRHRAQSRAGVQIKEPNPAHSARPFPVGSDRVQITQPASQLGPWQGLFAVSGSSASSSAGCYGPR